MGNQETWGDQLEKLVRGTHRLVPARPDVAVLFLCAMDTRYTEVSNWKAFLLADNDTRPCPVCGEFCSGCLEDLAAKQEGLRELLSYCRTQADGPTIDGIWGHNEVYDEIAKKLAPLLDGEA